MWLSYGIPSMQQNFVQSYLSEVQGLKVEVLGDEEAMVLDIRWGECYYLNPLIPSPEEA